jgi:hypothetical protein
MAPIKAEDASKKRAAAVPDDAPSSSNSNKRNKYEAEPDEENPQIAPTDTAEVENEENIAKLLSKHLGKNDSTIVETVLEKLANLCSSLNNEEIEKKNAEKIISLGGHAVILSAMTRHSTSRGVQAYGCLALRAVSYNCDTVDGPIGELDGVEVIIGALKTFPNDEFIQESGLCALFNLTLKSDENRHSFVKQKGIPVVVKAMQDFPNSTNLQDSSCRIFERICYHEEYCRPVIDGGGIVAVAQALKDHPFDADVQKNARDALKQMCAMY